MLKYLVDVAVVRHYTGRLYTPADFRATRVAFRLVPLPGGRTRLEGRTSYEVEMFPQGYWAVPAGGIPSAIHLRVLRHIKALAEGAP